MAELVLRKISLRGRFIFRVFRELRAIRRLAANIPEISAQKKTPREFPRSPFILLRIEGMYLTYFYSIALCIQKLPSILTNLHSNEYRYQKFCNRHCKPDGVCACQERKEEDEAATNDCASRHGYQERSAGL